MERGEGETFQAHFFFFFNGTFGFFTRAKSEAGHSLSRVLFHC